MLSEVRRNEIRKSIAKKQTCSINEISKEELVQYIYETQSIIVDNDKFKNEMYVVQGRGDSLHKSGRGRGTVAIYEDIGSAKRLRTRRGGKILKITEYEIVEDK